MRALLALLALAALLAAARCAADAPAEAPQPLRRIDEAELVAMEARLTALASDVERTLATAPGSPAPAEAPKAKLEYLQDSLLMSVDAVHDLRDKAQVGPSVQLRWRTLSRALWALSLRALLAFIDYIGALALLALATGKLWAFDLAYDDTQRLLFGLLAAATSGVDSLPWPWRSLAAPPLLLGVALPAALIFVVFVLQRVLVADRALLGFAALATAGHLAASALQPWHALPPGLPAASEVFWTAARIAAALLAVNLALRMRGLAVLV